MSMVISVSQQRITPVLRRVPILLGLLGFDTFDAVHDVVVVLLGEEFLGFESGDAAGACGRKGGLVRARRWPCFDPGMKKQGY